MIIGSHVRMGGKEMFLGSAREAVSYGANALMTYTGAPQNTVRKPVEELRIEEGWALLKDHGITDVIIHAPYIINLGTTVKPDIFELGVRFLATELERSAAMHGKALVLHPGAHVGAGEAAGLTQIAKGLNEVLTADTPVPVALETMAGKGSEVGRRLEELAELYDRVHHAEKLRLCLDTCHLNDAGYNLADDWESLLETIDHLFGLDQVAVVHLNDSKNERGAAKDRHENIGFGTIGFETLSKIAHCKELENVPKILETPYIGDVAPYGAEIAMLRANVFDPQMKEIR